MAAAAALSWPRMQAVLAPRLMAAAEACWMVRPSSMGSENGRPISTASAPASIMAASRRLRGRQRPAPLVRGAAAGYPPAAGRGYHPYAAARAPR